MRTAQRKPTTAQKSSLVAVAVGLFQCLCLFGLIGLMACGGEVTASFPGCEQCPERCLKTSSGRGACVQCLKDEQCQSDVSPTRRCVDNQCVCGSDKDCPDGQVCDGQRGCVGCKNDDDCKANKENPYCVENACATCKPGAVQNCAPDGGEVCTKGQQKCKVSGRWGDCEGFVVCQEGERCVNSKCVEPCPDPAPCQDGEVICLTPPNVYPGRYKSCTKDSKQCNVIGAVEKFCGAQEVCTKGQCSPFSCPTPECKEGEGRCQGDSSQQLCGRNGNGCIVWLTATPCNQGDKCRTNIGKCSVCEPGTKRKCYTGDPKLKGSGNCKEGEETCKADGTGYDGCIGEVLPKLEVCDGQDNDCDGAIDEDFTTLGDPCETGQGECKATGKLVCKPNGVGVICDAQGNQAIAEDCNGKDDDCDGKIDNAQGTTNPVTRNCYTGDVNTKNIGPCKEGTQTCVNTKWGPCEKEVKPATELCDRIDNDCDGQVDEDFSDIGKACTIGQGICKASGVFICSADKTRLECDAQKIQPQTEICDGKDNDCNGQIDDGNPGGGTACTVNGQIGDCRNGRTACDKGNIVCKQTFFGNPEVCNGKDDNCDGQIDEGLPTVDFYPDNDNDTFGDSNGAPVKKCAQQPPAKHVNNNTDCNDNNPNIKPSAAEICDGIDNNCNKQVDENIAKVTFYRDVDGDSYGVNSNSFQGCRKDTTTACTGLNACRTTTGYVTRGGDCCDTDDLAKPGQTTYFGNPNKCGNFDYNCNSKADANVTTCACSRQAAYTGSGSANYYYNSTRYGWSVQGSSGTYRNSTSCELRLSYSVTPVGDKTLRRNGCCYDCGGFPGIGNCGTCAGTKRRCDAIITLLASRGRFTWTPRTADNKNMIMWTKAGYKANCIYKIDGTVPKCGETGFRANTLETSSRTSLTRNHTFYSGTASCRGTCQFNYSATSSYQFNLNVSNYSYSKPSSTQVKVLCR